MTAQTVACVAVDDEPLALTIIEKFCERHGNLTLKTFTDPVEALSHISRTLPPIVFLDIEMENINGLNVARQLPQGTCVIFTTAYLEYAHHSYDLDAVDYLHKPFSYDRFKTAIAKAMRRIGQSTLPDSTATPQSITVKQEYQNVCIPLDDIEYVEAMEGYVKIYRTDGRCTISRMILKRIMEQLPSQSFVRIHRSYIISRKHLKSYSRREVILNSGTTLPIGRQYPLA